MQLIKKNKREREEERNEPEVIDSQMLWLLMHTLRRNAARRVSHTHTGTYWQLLPRAHSGVVRTVWYGILEFNVPLDTV